MGFINKLAWANSGRICVNYHI